MASPADILLVEDELDIVDFMARILRGAGFSVYVVADGRAAITAIRDSPPAVVILDLVLPIISGWGVLEYLHRTQSDIPVIVITANPRASARLSGYRVRHCLVKPFLMGELLGAISDVYPQAGPLLKPK